MTISLLILLALICILLERRWPAAALPTVKGWWARVALVNAAQLIVVLVAGVTWDHSFQQLSVFNLSDSLHPFAAALVAYLVSCFIYYWWHRYRHESPFFWRLCHQLHHSPRRIELLTSFYKHPVEITINSLLSSAIVYGLLGCDLKAAACYTFLIAIAEYFYHLNIRTPHWLGFIIQRPESHRVHHQFEQHTMNYGDLPILDWMFGTFLNPSAPVKACGFTAAQEGEFARMLLFDDVHQPARVPSVTCIGCRKRWTCAAANAPRAIQTPSPKHA